MDRNVYQLSTLLHEVKGIDTTPALYEFVLADQRAFERHSMNPWFAARVAIVLHVDTTDGYWRVLDGAKILSVSGQDTPPKSTHQFLYKGTGFILMHSGDAIEYRLKKDDVKERLVISYDDQQGIKILSLVDYLTDTHHHGRAI